MIPATELCAIIGDDEGIHNPHHFSLFPLFSHIHTIFSTSTPSIVHTILFIVTKGRVVIICLKICEHKYTFTDVTQTSLSFLALITRDATSAFPQTRPWRLNSCVVHLVCYLLTDSILPPPTLLDRFLTLTLLSQSSQSFPIRSFPHLCSFSGKQRN